MNNGPLTYIESYGYSQDLTLNVVMRGENVYTLKDEEADDNEMVNADKQLRQARQQ